MAITTAMCTSFKQELMEAKHNFLLTGGSTFKVALFAGSVSGTYGAATTNYSDMTSSPTEETSGTGYTLGGETLTRVDPATSGTTAYTDFADVQWTSASFTSAGCMIYNTSDSNSAVSVHDFSGDKTVSGGNFDLQFPTADSSNAILRLA